MTKSSFVEESMEQSEVKARLVSKYFWAWAKVMISTVRKRPDGRIAYIDLFAGPGRYEDGTKSTPLLILEQAIADRQMRSMLVTMFNDLDPDNTQSLQRAIDELPGIKRLRYPPEIYNEEVGEDIVRMFEEMRLVPTLFFVDPWGYKGLSLRLVNSVLKDWGCDCIFFFNYNRINMGLGNEFVRDHMDALFGDERGDRLRQRLEGMTPPERELTIVNEIAEALKEMGGRYVLPFVFRNVRGERTSHHLIFVSKHFKGYEIMKEIMSSESSETPQGVASFSYNPATYKQPLLFDLARPLDDLTCLLLHDFAGQTLTMRQVYEQHNVGTPYITKNYKDALRRLEAEGRVTIDPPAQERPRRHGEVTVADGVSVTFPRSTD